MNILNSQEIAGNCFFLVVNGGYFHVQHTKRVVGTEAMKRIKTFKTTDFLHAKSRYGNWIQDELAHNWSKV